MAIEIVLESLLNPQALPLRGQTQETNNKSHSMILIKNEMGVHEQQEAGVRVAAGKEKRRCQTAAKVPLRLKGERLKI